MADMKKAYGDPMIINLYSSMCKIGLMDARNTTFGTLVWPRIELNRWQKFAILASNEAGLSTASEAIPIPPRPLSIVSNVARSAVFQVQKLFTSFSS